jgi:hypothetical protein
MAKGEGSYILKVQSGRDGQIANGTAKGEMTYLLKAESGCDGSDDEKPRQRKGKHTC